MSSHVSRKKRKLLKKDENISQDEKIDEDLKDENISQDEKIDEDSKMHYSNFGYLPELVLFKIFSFLEYKDKRNAAYTCRTWYEATRDSTVWAKVNLKVKNPLHMLKSLLLLPPSVTYLNIYCDTFDRHSSLWLPDILTRIHERCPAIKTLIIENVFFAQRFCNTRFTTDHVLMHFFKTEKSEFSKHKERKTDIQQCKEKCCSEKIKRDNYIPKDHPQNLSILSLRYAYSYISHLSSYISQFFPKIKVLDLTKCTIIKSSAVPFFLNLKFLEELYLTGCIITNLALKSLLQNLKTLKVLDLECSTGVDNGTFLILREHGNSLEKLFLGNVDIYSFPVNNDSFPNLKQICLRRSFINDAYMLDFIEYLPNLKYIDVSYCIFVILKVIQLQAKVYGKELILFYDESIDSKLPCHHFKKKYM